MNLWEKIRIIASIMTACALCVGVGFEIGLITGNKGPFVTGTFTFQNASIGNTSLSTGTAGPCYEDSLFTYHCGFHSHNDNSSYDCWSNRTQEDCTYHAS